MDFLKHEMNQCLTFLYSFTYTVELQWLGHLWNHGNMFETGVVQANGFFLCVIHSAMFGGTMEISFFILFSMKVSPYVVCWH